MKHSNTPGRFLLGTLVVWVLWRVLARYTVSGLVAAGQRQLQPRRWPWQPKTIRDYMDERSAELAALAVAQGEALLRVAKQQSRPRRWPWQPKTIRDLIDERSVELASLAAERSAELAAVIAKRRDELLAMAQQQLRPRRWPWQPKTIRDRASERSVELASLAAKRSADLAALAATRRDTLLREAQRQLQPRRWPWQPKTARDRVDERRAMMQKVAARQWRATGAQVQQAARKAAEQVGPAAQEAGDTAAGRLKDLAAQGAAALQERASTTGGRVQELVAAVPNTLGSATATAAGTLKGTASSISKGIGDTASTAATRVQTVAQAPAIAMSRTVETGKRRVRYGMTLGKTALWALGIGVVVGLLISPQSGKELRRRIYTEAVRLLEMILQPNR